MIDLVIRNALLVDGTGSDPVVGSLAVSGTKIVQVGEVSVHGDRELDATGLALAPGFINAHSHADMVCESVPNLASDLEQGITTQVAGNCGIGSAPMSAAFAADSLSVTHMLTDFDFSRSLESRMTYSSYLESLRGKRFGTNLAMLVGHGSLRCAVMGLANRQPNDVELSAMKALLAEAMRSGAKGLSFGLEYPPGCFADIDEMTALAEVVAAAGGVVSAHIRNEDDTLVEAVDEMIEVAKRSGAKTVLSHHKTIYRRNWGKTVETLARVHAAREAGAQVYCDQYPYLAASTGLKSRLPAELYPLGDEAIVRMLRSEEHRPAIREKVLGSLSIEDKFGETMIGNSVSHPEFNGRYLLEIAKERNADPVYFLMELLADDQLTTNGIFTYMDDADVDRVMRNPVTMIGTDGLFSPEKGSAHPRAFGSFPRVLGRYVRERHVLTLQEAVRKMTSLTADVFGLTGKGRLAAGFDADLVLFNPDAVLDHATFAEFSAPNTGIEKVFVAGFEVLDRGKATGALHGTVC